MHLFKQNMSPKMADEISWNVTALRVVSGLNNIAPICPLDKQAGFVVPSVREIIILWRWSGRNMMTSSNGNIFHVTGPLCGEFTGPGEFPTQRPVTQSFPVFFDLRLNKRLSKQPWGWWFETPSWSLWRQCNELIFLHRGRSYSDGVLTLN